MNTLFKLILGAFPILVYSTVASGQDVKSWPVVCNKTEIILKEMKEEGLRPWITSRMENGTNTLITIWTNDADRIVISISGKTPQNQTLSCLIMEGTKDLQIFEKSTLDNITPKQ